MQPGSNAAKYNQLAYILLYEDVGADGFRECDQSSNSVVERFGRELLASIPKDSIVLTRGDLPGNSLRYLYYCQDVRPDVHLVDQEVSNVKSPLSRLHLKFCLRTLNMLCFDSGRLDEST